MGKRTDEDRAALRSRIALYTAKANGLLKCPIDGCSSRLPLDLSKINDTLDELQANYQVELLSLDEWKPVLELQEKLRTYQGKVEAAIKARGGPYSEVSSPAYSNADASLLLQSLLPTLPNGSITMTALPKAPKVTPTFSGRATDWPHFRDLIDETLSSVPSLSETYKKEVLAQAIPSERLFILGHDTYAKAIKSLATRYEEEEEVVNDIKRLASELPTLARNSSLDQWKRFQSSVLLIQSRSQSYDDAFKAIMHSTLKKKLGTWMFKYNERDGKQTLDSLVAFAQKRVTAEYRNHDDKEADVSKPAAKATAPSRSTGAKVNAALAQPNRTLVPCYFCKQNHRRLDCPLSKVDRKQGLRSSNRCFRCLAIRESGHSCTMTCRFCKAALHSLVCPCQPVNNAVAAASTATPAPAASGQTTQSTQANSLVPIATPPTAASNVVRLAYVGQVKEEILVCKEEAAYLPTLKIRVDSPAGPKVVRAMLDTGSTDSFISDSAAAEFGLPRTPLKEPTTVIPFGGGVALRATEKTRFVLRSRDDPNIAYHVEMLIVPGVLICDCPTPSTALRKIAQQHNITLADTPRAGTFRTDILIGQDLLNDLFLLPVQRSIRPSQGLAFVETRFGWVLQGCVRGGSQRQIARMANVAYVSTGPTSGPLTPEFRNFTTPRECVCKDLASLLLDPMSGEGSTEILQQDFVSKFWKLIEHDVNNKRYTVGLIYKSKERPHPNFEAAYAQFMALARRLRANGTFEQYNDCLMDFVTKGYARILDQYDPKEGYVIPHFPVFSKKSTTTPCRPVFNASAACKGKRSLNQCVYVGIWKQTELVMMIIKWRFYEYVALGDIRQAFLQIRIREEDRKYLRFLWEVDGQVRMFEMTSLLFGAASAPFILHAVLKHLFTTYASDLLEVVDHTYMDDSALFAKTMEALRVLIDRVQTTLALGSFTLHKWIAPPKVAAALELECKQDRVTWLGSIWDLQPDTIRFNVPLHPGLPLTRRALASVFALPFDVLGLLGPCHTRAKIFYRDVISLCKDWDTPLTPAQCFDAEAIIDDMSFVKELAFPRLVTFSDQFELWLFGDASAQAYGMCAYVYDLKSKQSRLLLSRGHLSSPNRKIPQLELIAAVLVADTATFIRKCLPNQPVRWRYFTDSTITLHRLRKEPESLDSFAKPRVMRILSLTQLKDWYHIPTKQNPADLVSRGFSIRLLRVNELWFKGFKGESPDHITSADAHTDQVLQVNMVVSTPTTSLPTDHMESIWMQRDHWSMRQLYFVTFRRMQDKFGIIERYEKEFSETLPLATLVDLVIWRDLQRIVLADELPLITQGTPLTDSPLSKLPLLIDKYGLVRLDRRLEYSKLPPEIIFPLVLKDHPAVRKYIAYVHTAHTYHSGARNTELYISRAFYIPNLARITMSVVKDCMHCRRFRTGVPFSVPMAPLPEDRVTKGRAFSVVGLDLFGPLHNDRGHMGKCYGLIFACAKSRAIHLEVVDSKEAVAIQRAFMRFCAIYGRPELVRCDNEKSFLKLNKTQLAITAKYKEAQDKLKANLGSTTIWQFNVPLAPWFGGFYERLIQGVKRALDRVRLVNADTFEQVLTIVRETQAMLNSRPLLHRAGENPITPAHLVLGHAVNTLEPIRFPNRGNKMDTLVDYAKFQQDLDQFWNIWQSEYLPSLRSHLWKKTELPELNELVILMNSSLHRAQWELGVVRRLIQGKDGYIRTAEVELCSGETRMRAIHRLIPIERDLHVSEATKFDVRVDVQAPSSPTHPSSPSHTIAAAVNTVELIIQQQETLIENTMASSTMDPTLQRRLLHVLANTLLEKGERYISNNQADLRSVVDREGAIALDDELFNFLKRKEVTQMDGELLQKLLNLYSQLHSLIREKPVETKSPRKLHHTKPYDRAENEIRGSPLKGGNKKKRGFEPITLPNKLGDNINKRKY